MELKRHDIINALLDKHGLATYLEIGTQNRKNCFDKINVMPHRKTCIDPDAEAKPDYVMTSDAFFAWNKSTFDLIFIDGLHESYQVKKDIFNSLNVLSPNGFIVMHDCNPSTELMQRVPRETKEWTGDVWKAFIHFRRRKDLFMYCVDTDYGCGVITRAEAENNNVITVHNPTYEELAVNRNLWLNLISPEQFQLENDLL